MIEKRYFLHKHFGRDVIHDTLCHNWLSREELEEHMNVQYTKYSDLKKENEQLKKVLSDAVKDREVIVEDLILWSGGLITELEKENEQLQSEVNKLTDLIASEIEKNAKLLQENNSLKIENMRLKELKE